MISLNSVEKYASLFQDSVTTADTAVVSFACPQFVPGCPWAKVEKIFITVWNASEPQNALHFDSDNLEGSVSVASELGVLKEYIITGIWFSVAKDNICFKLYFSNGGKDLCTYLKRTLKNP